MRALQRESWEIPRDLSCGNPLRYETGTRKLTTSLLSLPSSSLARSLFHQRVASGTLFSPRAGPDRKMGSLSVCRVPSTLSGLYPPGSIPVSPILLSLFMPASRALGHFSLVSRTSHHPSHHFLARASFPLIVGTKCTGHRKILDDIIIIASISARRPLYKMVGFHRSLCMSPSRPTRPDDLDASLHKSERQTCDDHSNDFTDLANNPLSCPFQSDTKPNRNSLLFLRTTLTASNLFFCSSTATWNAQPPSGRSLRSPHTR